MTLRLPKFKIMNYNDSSIKVKQVYLAAWQLRMERVVNECASHLINDLTKDTCLDTRSLPGINHNKSFVEKVDQYIAENVRNSDIEVIS